MTSRSTTPVTMRALKPSSRGETAVRYFAAYGCTLVAIAAAQLSIENEMALGLAVITLLGLPLSLWLRWTDLRFGRRHISRFFINSMVVILALCGSLILIMLRLPIFAPEQMLRAVVTQGMGESIGLLMQVFLIFAVSRCLAIITDKDAVQCAIPSFSVLLLLIVVQRGPEVVAYFLLWAILAAILFAVDHRADSREGVLGVVPSTLPGQDISLSARSLATVLGLSLACAATLSYTISSRDPENRGTFENWVIQMAGKVTTAALNMPEVSVSSGPERQIDFSSGPALPTNAPLWRAQAVVAETGETIRPSYWRMFSLAAYNGTTWSQLPGNGEEVRRRQMQRPRRRTENTGRPESERRSDGRRGIRRRGDGRRGDGEVRGRSSFYYYDIALSLDDWQRRVTNLGAPRTLVIQQMRPLISVTGYLPALPVVDAVQLPYNETDLIRARSDGTVDVQVLQAGQDEARVRSQVPAGNGYGVGNGGPPLEISAKPNPAARLTPEEQRLYLQIYDSQKLARVRQLAQRVVRSGEADDSNYAKARRLAIEIQRDSVYTLRPPIIPEGRDATDFFLFEGRRRGYCTYFAGALAVMCRTVGIPARVVSGFAGGEWKDDAVTLLESNAHAWTEVWVPNYGWATVDATPADDRGDNAPSWYENWTEVFGAGLGTSWTWIRTRILFLAMGLTIAIGVAFVWLAKRRGLHWLPRSLWVRGSTPAVSDDAARRAVFDSYRRATRQLARHFRRRAAWETPEEWTQAALSTLHLSDPNPLRRLTDLYVRAKYSTTELGASESDAAREALRALNWQRADKTP